MVPSIVTDLMVATLLDQSVLVRGHWLEAVDVVLGADQPVEGVTQGRVELLALHGRPFKRPLPLSYTHRDALNYKQQVANLSM